MDSLRSLHGFSAGTSRVTLFGGQRSEPPLLSEGPPESFEVGALGLERLGWALEPEALKRGPEEGPNYGGSLGRNRGAGEWKDIGEE